MQNAKDINNKALEALLSSIEPDQVLEAIAQVLMDYVPTNEFCQRNEIQRQNIVFVFSCVTDFFIKLHPSSHE